MRGHKPPFKIHTMTRKQLNQKAKSRMEAKKINMEIKKKDLNKDLEIMDLDESVREAMLEAFDVEFAMVEYLSKLVEADSVRIMDHEHLEKI